MIARTIATCLAITTAATAHEFWIEPLRFHAGPNEKIDVVLGVGEQFKGEPAPRKNDRIKVFSYFAPGRNVATPIAGEDGKDPAGHFVTTGDGLYILGYHNTPSKIELSPQDFEDYLRHDGMEHVVELRKELGESAKPGRELYARCAKSLVLAGQPTDAGLERRFGFPLEIVPRSNPLALQPGQLLEVALFFEGKPAANVKVMAMRRGSSEKIVSARTDREGAVRLPLDESGTWLLAAVHMIRLENNPDADWHSFWASLTFDNASRKGGDSHPQNP